MGRDRALGDGEATPRTRLCDKVAFSHGRYKKRGKIWIAIIAEVAIIKGGKEAGTDFREIKDLRDFREIRGFRGFRGFRGLKEIRERGWLLEMETACRMGRPLRGNFAGEAYFVSLVLTLLVTSVTSEPT